MRATDSAEVLAPPTPAPQLAGAPLRPRPATCVLSGELPDPLLSSRGRGWDGITVELQSFHDLDSVVQAPDHVIAVQLGGHAALQRTRDGRTKSRTMNVGDVTISPIGGPIHWRQSGHSLVVLLRLASEYVRRVAGDECALDPDRFEIQAVF